MAKKPFSYDLCLEDRLDQLVNNEYSSDVFFKVGEAGELMFAHKNIITTASEVFYVQLNGHFNDAVNNSRDNPIEVKDISPAIFLEILRFMYSERLNFNGVIFLELYYAAKKYMLNKLVNVCEKYIRNEIKEDNVLQIFNDNRRYEFDNINVICLQVICDNPLECFEQKQFLSLEKTSLKMILDCCQINCHEDHLAKVTQKWLEVNDGDKSKDFSDLVVYQNARELLCQKLYAFSAFRYSNQIKTDMLVEVYETFNLYGFGILIGSRTANVSSVILNIRIRDQGDEFYKYELLEGITIPVREELYVYEMIFKKITLQKDAKYRFIIELEANDKPLEMFHLDFFQPAGETWKRLMMLTYTSDVKQNCLSYMLYDIHQTE